MPRAGFTLLLIAILAACSGPNFEHAAERKSGGPLDPQLGYVSYYPAERIGDRFSEGFLLLSTSSPITVESVEVSGGEDALEFLGARIGLPGRPDDFNQLMSGYPPAAVPPELQVRADGAQLVPAGGTYMLILGYRVKRLVMDRRASVTVNYRDADETRYFRKFPANFVVCPPSIPEERCSEVAHERYGEIL